MRIPKFAHLTLRYLTILRKPFSRIHEVVHSSYLESAEIILPLKYERLLCIYPIDGMCVYNALSIFALRHFSFLVYY